MAYATTNPPKQVEQGIGAAPSMWMYSSADAHGTVIGAGYFTNGAALGIKANDVMVVVDTATPTCVIIGMASATTGRAATLA